MEIKNFIKYIAENKLWILKLAIMSSVTILLVAFCVPKSYERTVYMHIPYEYESRQINEIVELIKADKDNDDWVLASVVKNTNLIKLRFKGDNKDSLIKKSDEYLYDKITYLSEDYNNKIKEIENAKRINRQLEYSLLQKNENNDNVQEGRFYIEYIDDKENQSEFPPAMYKLAGIAILVGCIFSFLVMSIRYIAKI